MVSQKGLPWRTAYQIVAIFVRQSMEAGKGEKDVTPEMVDRAAVEYTGKPVRLSAQEIKHALDPLECVKARTLIGGPAPDQVRRQIEERPRGSFDGPEDFRRTTRANQSRREKNGGGGKNTTRELKNEKGENMPNFKLISADSHVNEPPAAWERVQKEYGGAGSEGGKRPARRAQGNLAFNRGTASDWLLAFFHRSRRREERGDFSGGRGKTFEAIHFNERFRYEDYPGGWEPSQRLKDQDADGVEAEILFPVRRAFFMP